MWVCVYVCMYVYLYIYIYPAGFHEDMKAAHADDGNIWEYSHLELVL